MAVQHDSTVLDFCQKEYKDLASAVQLISQKHDLKIPAFPSSEFELDDEIEVKLIDIGSHHFFDCGAVPYV